MSKRTKDKDLEKLDVIKDSPQMSLFEIIESPAKKDDYSNTIEIDLRCAAEVHLGPKA